MNLKGYHEIKQTSVGILPTLRKLIELEIRQVNFIDLLLSWIRSEFSVMKVEGDTKMDLLTRLLPCSALSTGAWSVEWKLWHLRSEILVAAAVKPTVCCYLTQYSTFRRYVLPPSSGGWYCYLLQYFTPWTLCRSNDIYWWSRKSKQTFVATWRWKQQYIQKPW